MSFNIGSVSADITADNSKFIKAFNDSGRAVDKLGDNFRDLERRKRTLQEKLDKLRRAGKENTDQFRRLSDRLENLKDRSNTARNRIERLDNSFDRAKASTKGFSDSLQRIGDFVIGNLIADGIRNLTSSMVDFARNSIISGTDYEQAMNVIQTAGGESNKTIQRLKQSTIDIGNQTKFSAGEVADAYRMWQKNGRDLEEGLNGGIETSLKFAQITGSDLSQSVDFATDIMALYGKRIDENTDLSKLFIGATEQSKHSGTDLAGVFRRGAVAASNFADPIESLGGLIAITSQAFDSAEEQGTALSAMLERFRTSKAREELGKIGISTRDSNGDMRAYMDILRDLKGEIDKVGGIQSQKAQDMLANLFPDIRQRRGAEATLKNLDDFQDKMQAIADTPVDGLLEATMNIADRLASFLDTLMIRFTQLEVNGRPLIQLFTDFGGEMLGVAGVLADKFLPVFADIVEFIINYREPIVAAIMGMAGGLLYFLAPALGAAATALWALIAPALPFIAIGALIGVALWGIYEAVKWIWEGNFLGIQGIVGGLVSILRDLWGVLMANLMPVLNNFWNIMKELWNTFVSAVSPALRDLQAELQRLWDVISPILIPILNELKAVLVDTIKHTIDTQIKPVLAFLQEVLQIVLPHAINIFNTALNNVKNIISIVASFIQAKGTEIQNIFKNLFQLIGNLIRGDFNSAWENLKEIIKSIGDLDLFQLGKDLLQGFINGIKSMAGAVMNAAKGIADSAKNAITSALQINSPSRFGIWVGQMTGDGVIGGLDKSEKGVNESAKNLTDRLKSGILQEAIATPTNNMQTINNQSSVSNNNTNNFNISGAQNPMNIAQIIDQRIAQSNRNNRLNSNQVYA